MIRIGRTSAAALAGIAGALALAGAAAPAVAAGSIKAAYVEQVIPARTFFGRMSVLNTTNSVGPGANGGIFGVTSLTLTNFDTSPQQVFVFVPIFSGGGCGSGGSNIVGGTEPQMTVYVAPQSTLHLTYPTPMVINPYANITCIAAEVTTLLHGGSVQIDVNGVVN
jgi:hypothetical protein